MVSYSTSIYTLRPRKKDPAKVKAAIGYQVETKASSKFSLPKAQLGISIPYLIGTGRVLEPNIIWRGNADVDQEQTSITDPETGNVTKVTYQDVYILDLQFGLALGPGVKLRGINQDDVIMWGGNAGPGRTEITATLESDMLNGGAIFFGGEFNQIADPLLIAAQPLGAPAYPGIAHIILKRVKLSQNYGNITFDLERLPNPLGLTDAQNSLNGDVNIATALVDVMTNDWGGAKIPITQIDLANFTAAAVRLASEGNFCSIMSTDSITANDIIEQLEAQARGSVYINPNTGLLNFALIRYEGVSLAPKMNFDESNVINLQEFGGSSWATVANQKKVTYNNRADNYKEGAALAQNISVNATAGRAIVNDPTNYPFVTNGTLANKLAARDLAIECVPSFAGTIETHRVSPPLIPGDIIGLTWEDYEFENVLCFVTKSRQLDITSERTVLEVSQLVFPDSAALIQSPDEDYSDQIRFTPQRPTGAKIITAPFYIAKTYASSNAWQGTTPGQLQQWNSYADIAVPLVFALADSPDQQSFDAFIDLGGGDFQRVITAGRYATSGVLAATMGRFDGFNNELLTITINDVDREDNLLQQGGPYLMNIGNELLPYQDPVKISDGVWTIKVRRGWMDTVAEAHGAGSICYLISGNHRNYTANAKFTVGDAAPNWRLTGRTKQGVTATSIGFFLSSWVPSSRFVKPIRASGVMVNGGRSAGGRSVTIGAVENITWTKRSRFTGSAELVSDTGGKDDIESIVSPTVGGPLQSYQQHAVWMTDGGGVNTMLFTTVDASFNITNWPGVSFAAVTIPANATPGSGLLWVETTTGGSYPGASLQVDKIPINIS